MPMIQSLVSSTGKMRSASRAISRNAWQSSRSACTGKDPPPRVRQICCRTPGRAGPGQAGDVRFPGAYALLQHQKERRRLPTRAQDTEKATESQAPGDQGNTTTAQAYAD